MAYFTVTGLRVLMLLLGTTKGIGAVQPDYSIVANILQTLFKTYTQSQHTRRNFADNTESINLSNTVEKVIRQKIDDLKPYLQDYDNTANQKNKDASEDDNNLGTDDNVTLEGEEDTTIIEFLPETENAKQQLRIREVDTRFKENVKKYKRIRNKIKHVLIEESVSLKTQNLVTHTLDSMLAYMVRSQCPDNSEVNNDIYRERLRAEKVVQATKEVMKNWTEQWDELKEKYNKIWSDHFPQQPNPARKLFTFFEQIQDYLTHIGNDTDNLSNNYRVVCKLVKGKYKKEAIKIDDSNVINLRKDITNKKLKCAHFKVCSGELENFMRQFYKNLNDTAVNTFANYAAMYMSDVNTDGSGEKENLIAVVKKFGDTAKLKVKKIFNRETSEFELDKDKNADENMKRLKSFVNNVIEKCLAATKKYMNESEIDDSIRNRLVATMKQDLAANIDVDLGNLEAEMKKAICRDFSTCNGRLRRRSFDGETDAEDYHTPVDKDKVYVKLQLTMDKSLRNKLALGDLDFLDFMWNTELNERAKPRKIKVTRTTYARKPHHGSPFSDVTRTTPHEYRSGKFTHMIL